MRTSMIAASSGPPISTAVRALTFLHTSWHCRATPFRAVMRSLTSAMPGLGCRATSVEAPDLHRYTARTRQTVKHLVVTAFVCASSVTGKRVPGSAFRIRQEDNMLTGRGCLRLRGPWVVSYPVLPG